MGKPFDWMNFKQDNREPRGGWAAGWYTCKCNKCGDSYMGAKRSWHCADCAYLETPIQSALSEIGIEKPSDVSLVLERAREMMNERLVEKVARALASCDGSKITGPSRHKASDAFGWDAGHCYLKQYEDANWQKFITDAHFAIEASGLSELITTSSTLVEEMKAMGYGETSDRPLPGAWDGFVEALARARG